MAVKADEAATKRDLAQAEEKLTGKIDQVEQSLSAKIDANGVKIEANSAKIDQVEERLSAKIDASAASIHRLTVQVTKNGEAIKGTLTREEYKKDYNELLRELDGMMVVLLRVDQERAATNAWLGRVEADVQELKAR